MTEKAQEVLRRLSDPIYLRWRGFFRSQAELPDNPNRGDTAIVGPRHYVYDGDGWVLVSTSTSTPP